MSLNAIPIISNQLIRDAFHKLTFKTESLDIPERGRDSKSRIPWRSKSAPLEDFENKSDSESISLSFTYKCHLITHFIYR